MIDGALPYLRCPLCEQSLRRLSGTLRCERGHSFDLARQGYADLSAGRLPYAGDTAEMVADRAEFLAAGHYSFVADALADRCAGPGPVSKRETGCGVAPAPAPALGLIVDAGTGTGDYLARVLTGLPGAVGLGLDVSKPALRRAARSHPRAAAVRADLWRTLPVVDGAASVILNVFAPRNGPEYRRVLRPDGLLLVVTPAADHLCELISAHGLIGVDPDKAARVDDALGDHFAEESRILLRRELRLTAAEARTLIGMTPSAHHVPASALPTAPVTTTTAVHLTAYRPL